MQTEKKCYISGRTDMLERHHVFGGANRKNSEKYGLVVWLNHYYHNEPKCAENCFIGSPHHNEEVMVWLRQQGQLAFEKEHTHEEFMQIFGKNYL